MYPSDCVADCGVKVTKDVHAFVIKGNATTINEHPWHVGIYRVENKKIKHICGGSIINPKFILTGNSFWSCCKLPCFVRPCFCVFSAAHCFADIISGVKLNYEYHVAAGKTFRDWDDKRDEFTAVKRKVS